MPVTQCSSGKWKIGQGGCVYETEEKAMQVWKAILAGGKFADSYTDYPESASNNAKRAIEWAEKNGWGSCLEATGKARARQLANREPISRDTIARMASFARHKQHSDRKLGDGCGRLAWLAWGGDEGVEWASRKLKEIDNK
jgi:hypothetical protein